MGTIERLLRTRNQAMTAGLLVAAIAASTNDAIAQLSDPCGAWTYGSSQAVALDEARQVLFTSSGGAVLVWDVSEPFNPSLASSGILTRGWVLDLFYTPSNQRLYAATGEGGLEVWDVREPSSPSRLGRHDLTYFGVPAPAEAVHVLGDFAYVSADFGLVQRVDIREPANMRTVSFHTNFGMTSSADVFIADGHLYSAGNRLVKFQIRSDGSLQPVNVAFSFGRRVFVRGNFAYLSDLSGFSVIDIVSSGFPYLRTVANYSPTRNVREVVFSGTRAYAIDPFEGVTVYDATDPVQLLPLTTFGPGPATRMVLDAGVGYTASGGLSRIIDFSDPNNITQTAALSSMGGLVYGADVAGTYVYLAGAAAGLQVIQTDAVEHPEKVAELAFPDIALDVELAGQVAYVAARQAGLRVVDVSDPTNPFETGAANGFGYARRVAVDGDYAYVTELLSGVRVVDVSDRSNPHEVAFISLQEFTDDVFVEDPYLYIVAGDAGLFVFDISDPTQPLRVGSLANLGSASGVFVLDGLAYVTDFFNDRVRILDLSTPASPQVIGTYFQAGLTPGRVAVAGDRAYVTDAGKGVVVLDISDPRNPTQLETINTPGTAFDVELEAGRVYIADGYTGLRIHGDCAATGCLCGDANCDEALNGGDIDPFFLALGDPAAWQAAYPACNRLCAADVNGDGSVNGGDIDAFFRALGAGGCP